MPLTAPNYGVMGFQPVQTIPLQNYTMPVAPGFDPNAQAPMYAPLQQGFAFTTQQTAVKRETPSYRT